MPAIVRARRGDASLRDAPAFRRFAAALPSAGLPPTGFNSGPRFLGRRPDAERPAFPILQYSELLAGRSLCRPGGVYRQLTRLIVKVLGGVEPKDLPVEQPTKFDLVVNLKTAKALGLTISESFLARADEVIE